MYFSERVSKVLSSFWFSCSRCWIRASLGSCKCWNVEGIKSGGCGGVGIMCLVFVGKWLHH